MNVHDIPPPVMVSRLDAEAFPDVFEPDIDLASAYLKTLDPNATAFTFQTFDDKKKERQKTGLPERKHLACVVNGSLDDVFPDLRRRSLGGAGVFVTINKTDLKGRETKNILEVRALFVDLDGAPLGNIARLGLAPAAITQSSPGRYHALWNVTGISLEEFKTRQLRLAALMEGDPSMTDLSRVLRLPGFAHQKSEPVMVRARYPQDGGKTYGPHGVLIAPYSRETFLAALDAAETKHRAAPVDADNGYGKVKRNISTDVLGKRPPHVPDRVDPKMFADARVGTFAPDFPPWGAATEADLENLLAHIDGSTRDRWLAVGMILANWVVVYPDLESTLPQEIR